MARIRLFSHNPSDTIGRLKDTLEAAGHNVKKLKRVGGTYRGRAGDFVFNYGSSQLSSDIIGQATVVNAPEIIGRASNKRDAFARMVGDEVRCVEHTISRQVAEQWVRDGALVYIRTSLQGHSGQGIQLAHNNPVAVGDAGGFPISADVPNAPLYTKGVLGNRREYRVHVFKGKIIHVAQKRRRDGFNEIPEHSNLVRNHHTGWIYSTQNMTTLNDAGKCEALKAMASLGLDYGAVDVITNRNEAWILEVNTAPGMEGVTLEKYTAAISQFVSGEEVVGETIEGFVNFRQTAQVQEPARANNSNSNTRRNEQPAPQQPVAPQPAAPEQPVARAIPPAPTARTESANQRSNRTQAAPNALINGAFYWLTINGEITIGKFTETVNSFEIIGWEVPVERAEATVGAQIVQ